MRRWIRSVEFLAAVAGLLLVSAAKAQPDAGSLAQVKLLEDTLAAVADQVRPSVVAIRADRRLGPLESDDGQPATPDEGPRMPDDETHRGLAGRLVPAVGSGLIISADGLILTNEHVIHNSDPEAIEVLVGDDHYTAQGITSDPRSDLAVLRIEARGLKAARLGDLSSVRQGHFAIVMGNPFGSASEGLGIPAMSFGIISALGKDLTQKLERRRYYGNLIQTDARINPGNSGGPLLNIKGEVIGINTAISTRSGGSEGVGYAIAIDERTKAIINQLARGERVEYGYLGVVLKEPTREDRERAGGPERSGALIEEIQAGTPAAVAHLQPGDIVVEFDGQPVENVDKVIRLVGAASVDVAVEVAVYRNRKRMTLSVTPARREEVIEGVNIEVPLSWRGMTLENPTPEVCGRFELPATTGGIVVTYVEAGGAAEKAGLKPGQVIRRIGDEVVKGVRRVRNFAPDLGGPVKIVVHGDPPREITLP